ncbi:MAG TPA: 2Fe-2S iron-sulfur cluster-binding protein [Acidimicrobiales bacterium]
MTLTLQVDGREVEVVEDGASLLEVLRDRLGLRSVKDGCSPQGQCGCCTVLVDGSPRVACVTPARRVAGRRITTVEGIPRAERDRWADAFVATGASQCGFCTPGIIVRLAAAAGGGPVSDDQAGRCLLAHLCRCTGWRSVLEAAVHLPAADPARDLAAAGRRATIEGGTIQHVGPDVALGRGGFADDLAPADALVAVSDGRGGWAVGETLSEARRAARTVQGRRSGSRIGHPLELPTGPWSATLRTTWVEPAYVELDGSWCRPGGEPASPLGNGGAFGAKLSSPAPAAARRLADQYGRAVRVLLSREDSVRLGPKRPPIAAGVRSDGSGILRVARTPGIAAAVAALAPGLSVEEVDVIGPPTSARLRAAGWAEAAVLLAALAPRADTARSASATIRSPAGATATARADVDEEGRPTAVRVAVGCGDPLDEVVLRSYAVGAAHMAMGWVCSEAIAVDDEGRPQDLTIRSFGVLRAIETPPVAVTIDADDGPPVNGSDAVFAAVAAAVWIAQGAPPDWPTRRGVPHE